MHGSNGNFPEKWTTRPYGGNPLFQFQLVVMEMTLPFVHNFHCVVLILAPSCTVCKTEIASLERMGRKVFLFDTESFRKNF